MTWNRTHVRSVGSGILEKARFRREGVLRDYAFMKGQFLDVEVCSLLKREFGK